MVLMAIDNQKTRVTQKAKPAAAYNGIHLYSTKTMMNKINMQPIHIVI